MGHLAVAAIASLVLTPFGSVSDHLQSEKPWFGFDAQDPILSLVRVQKVQVKSCKAWTEALISVPAHEMVHVVSPVLPKDSEKAFQSAWGPWGEKDLDAVKSCDDYPCQVKFNEVEVKEMAKRPSADRLAGFYSLITQRLQNYVKTGVRKGYEMPGDPVDPWKILEERGLKSSLSRPEKSVLFARKLNFAKDKMLTMHQVLDRRVAHSHGGSEAVVWTRDAYTDHYFDSWGEVALFSCDAKTREAVMIEALISEMDLLKKSGIFMGLIRGKYRSAFEENGKIYLDQQFEWVNQAARKLESAIK